MATEDNTIETIALGRPFGLGMLYDCRNDKLIPAMSLWNPEVLENQCVTRKQPFTNYTVRTEKSLHDKAHLLNMGGSLKLSVLGGLIGVSGSAKYVNDRKETKHEERVTLKYSTTVHYKQLTMGHLATEKMIHTDILDQDVATHVVTGIVYGADAFFVFNRALSKNEENTTVSGKLEVLLNKLPKIDISAGVELNMNNDDKQLAESLTCTFYGDFNLEQNPSTFEEAVKLYKMLPSVVGVNGENTVAKTVYLYPLRLLNRPNMKMIRQISQNLIDNCVSLINDLYQLKMQASDIINDGCPTVHQNKEHLKIFINYINQFENDVKKEMMELLPKIRGNGADEIQLRDFLNQVESSPFNRQKLSDWIKLKEREITMESNFIQHCIADPRVDSSLNALDKALSDSQCVHIICLSIHLTNKNDFYLQDLSRYLDDKTFNRREETTQSSWLDEEDVLAEIREKIAIFFDSVQGNVDNRKIKFVITDKHIDKQKNLEGIFLNFYEKGRKKNVEIPSKPGQPIATEIKDDCILLTWKKPQNGNINVRQYKIIYSKENDEKSKSELIAANDSESLLIQNLTPNTTYIFTVQVLTTIGLVIDGDMSDPITIKPPEQNKTKSNKFKQNGIICAGENGYGGQSNQLYRPQGIFIDHHNNILIADSSNNRIVERKCHSNEERVIAGGNGPGKGDDQLFHPTDVLVDKKNNCFIISDLMNRRVIRCFRENEAEPQILISDIDCFGLSIDKNGFIYVSDRAKNEVRRWKKGDERGTIVAGRHRKGTDLNQLNGPGLIFVDEEDSLYVSDTFNHRVMKWTKNAKEGIVVAGGNGEGNSLKQLSSPWGVIVDDLGQIYVADHGNHRVMRWCEGNAEGEVVIGGKGRGKALNQLNHPSGLSFDTEENLYVADYGNDRILKYEQYSH
ncbi:unnamed protein product [Adineta steineri]|uniref:Fibronectin type-III domain-containing protein n=1 Tax=Adineta steineri TaxID=433720 RepID=A0A815K1S4_9BILA|nr:unnamed protein product [Adineta steineri]CAF3625811.1 unnamed protein product [Adineta steineri]